MNSENVSDFFFFTEKPFERNFLNKIPFEDCIFIASNATDHSVLVAAE